MTVTLNPSTESRIQERIDSGQYASADDVIAEALLALDERERMASLRAKLQVGLDQIERGEVIPFTPEWRSDRLRIAKERAAAGERPSPDVCP